MAASWRLYFDFGSVFDFELDGTGRVGRWGWETHGWLAPPSRKEPDCESAVIRFLGPRTQQTRQPGRRQFCIFSSDAHPQYPC